MTRFIPMTIMLLAAAQFSVAAHAGEIRAEDSGNLAAVHYTRVGMDQDGNTYFADHDEAFELNDYAPPAGPVGVAAMQTAQSLVFTTLAGKWDGDWHPAPRRQYAVLLSGTVEIEVTNGETREFKCGDIVLLEDTSGRGHDTRVQSDEPAVFAIVAVQETP